MFERVSLCVARWFLHQRRVCKLCSILRYWLDTAVCNFLSSPILDRHRGHSRWTSPFLRRRSHSTVEWHCRSTSTFSDCSCRPRNRERRCWRRVREIEDWWTATTRTRTNHWIDRALHNRDPHENSNLNKNRDGFRSSDAHCIELLTFKNWIKRRSTVEPHIEDIVSSF